MSSVKQSVAAKLKSLLYKVYENYEDKYLVLKKRDDLLSKARKSDDSATNIITGTLKELCPEKERYSRLMQGTENYYECDDGVFNPDKAVKEYSRSAADQDLPLSHEMRPIETLELTMDYLIQEVADDICSNSTELLRWFDFLWNRTRAIRKDITQQQLVSERVVGLIEKCARFHIFSGYKLAPLAPQFDQRLNIENLNKCLLSLRHCYDDLARKNVICQNEAEFRSYDILLNLCDSNVFNQSIKYREEIQNNKAVKNALEIALAYHTNNISRFFKLVDDEDTSFLQACLAYNHFQAFRVELLIQASMAFSSESILSYLTPYFAFDNDKDCLDFLTFHGCTVKESRAERTIVSLVAARRKTELKDSPDPIVARKLKSPISEVIYNGTPPKVCLPKAVNSFDDQNRYVNDPVMNEFLKDVGEVPEVFEDKKEFLLTQSSNNLLFAGYPKNPNEAVPVVRFIQPITQPKISVLNNSTLKPLTTESQKSLLTAPSVLTFANTFSLTKAAMSPAVIFQPLKPSEISLPATMKPSNLPSGPTKDEIEAIACKVAEEEKRKREAEVTKIVGLTAEMLVEEIFTKAVRTLVLKSYGVSQKRLSDIHKENKHLVRVCVRSLYRDLIRGCIKPFAEEIYNVKQLEWSKLEAIRTNLYILRLSARCSRYIAIWKWAVRIKKERRTIGKFSEALKNRNNDSISGISKSVKRSFGTPITEADAERLSDIRIRRFQGKYFNIWRNAVAARKRMREEKKFKLSPNNYKLGIPNLYQIRQQQKKVLYEGNMFPNRKRLPPTTKLAQPLEKRFFTSTPLRNK